MKNLFLIPARGSSKGLPEKNIKPLNGKPLIYYTIDCARQVSDDSNICVSTDDEKIIKTVEDYGLVIPFKRPAILATDTATSEDVITHALKFYEDTGIHYDTVVLLQPTSPLRKTGHIREALAIYDNTLEMVVSVKEADANPYYNLVEENKEGFLEKSKKLNGITRRQDAPKVYAYNGAIYVINVNSFKELKSLSAFTKVKKYEMNKIYSIDIDDILDFMLCETILNRKLISL